MFALRLLQEWFIGKAVDSHQQQAPTNIKIFAAGFGRTGTVSFAAALEQLGYTIMHGAALMDHADLIADYYENRTSGTAMLETLGDRGFDAVGFDLFSWLYEDALAIPDAKIILTVRDTPEKWAESWMAAAGPQVQAFVQRPFLWLPVFQKVNGFMHDYLRVTGCGDTHKYNSVECLAQGYTRHVEAVKAAVPADRLLVFNVKEGWQPLCEFLHVQDCPTTPFPRINDRAATQAMATVMVVVSEGWPLLLLALLAVAGWVAGCCVRACGAGLKQQGKQHCA